MTTRELTIAALVAAVIGPGVYVLNKSGANERVVLVTDTAGKTELAGADADAVLLDDAGEPRRVDDGSKVSCATGGYLDGVQRDDLDWCQVLDAEGKPTGQAWVRATKGAETMEIAGGKVYVESKVVVEAEAVK